MPPGLRAEIINSLNQSFYADGVAAEVAYFQQENRKSFERPYGVAWFLQLTAELREWDDPMAEAWLETLLPLEVGYCRADHVLAAQPGLSHPAGNT